ncbi:MAG: GH3 auxin-responsive promoter family protein [Bacteroidia bacterium]
MKFLGSRFLGRILSLPYRQIERHYQSPHYLQRQTWEWLVAQAQNTLFFHEHHLTACRSYEDFRQKVPIRTYEELFPYIHRTLQGEKDILWPGRVTWFAKSSGTTNDRSKFIPMPKAMLYRNHFASGKALFATYLHFQPHSRLPLGKVLSIGGSHEISRYNAYARYGDLSAVLIENMPWFYQIFRAPSKKIALLSDWKTKIFQMAQATLYQPIVGVAGVPTWTVVLFEEVLRQSGKTHILEVWPHFEVFFHGAVSFTPYEATFRQFLPSPSIRYIEIYNASEGFFAFQDQLDVKDMLLLLSYGVFYEFIPLEALEKKDWTAAVPLEGVEKDRLYALILSSASGLWRYLIGDTIRFTSIRPYKIRIAGRTKHFINVFGEEVVVENAEAALKMACQATGAQVRDFTVAPIYLEAGKKGAHQWIIEFHVPPQDRQKFVFILDQALQKVNTDYEAKRSGDMALVQPQVVEVPPGTFERWLARKGRLGGQNKVPRLSNTREYAEDILADLSYRVY